MNDGPSFTRPTDSIVISIVFFTFVGGVFGYWNDAVLIGILTGLLAAVSFLILTFIVHGGIGVAYSAFAKWRKDE